MSDIPRILPSTRDDDEAVLGGQIAAMYAATPVADADAALRCAQTVWANAHSLSIVRDARTRKADHSDSSWRQPIWYWGVAAAALLVIAIRPWSSSEPSDGGVRVADLRSAATPSGTVTAVSGSDAMRFDLTLPSSAREVAIVGDFNGWDATATPMAQHLNSRGGRAIWSAQIALAPGRHVYAFVVDGAKWLVDPLAPQVPDSGFGPSNAVIVDGGLQ